jgi:branched-chain amino acid transport system permease protein
VVLSGLIGAVAAMVVGLPALRFRGLYLAVTTFAFALATTSYLLDRQYFSWVPSQRVARQPLLGLVDISSATSVYYVMLGALGLVLVGLRGIRHSRTGRVLVAMRDNERAAQAYGISALRVKLTAFAVSGFLAAAAGSLFLAHQQALGSSPYAPSQNLAIFAMVVVGGVTSLGGALLGALYFQGTGWFLPLDWQFVASGFGVLVVLLVLPGGFGGLLYAIRDHGLRWVAGRRDIVVPSLLADSREVEPEPEPTPLPTAGEVPVPQAGVVLTGGHP